MLADLRANLVWSTVADCSVVFRCRGGYDYCQRRIRHRVNVVAPYADEFSDEVAGYARDEQDKIAALSLLLEQFGPHLGRPRVDTLKGSRHANMRELRFVVDDAEWRLAFAFDPKRRAILLAAGNKQSVGEKRFYRELIRLADARFDKHLAGLK